MSNYFKELKKLKKRKNEKVIFLEGNDLFMKQEFVRTLFSTYPDVERKVYYGSQNRDDDVEFLNNLLSFGLFSSKKLIVYHNIEQFTKKYGKRLLQYLENPDKNIVLILTAERKRKKLVQAISKKSYSIKAWTPYPNKYVDFVQQQATRMGIDATTEAINLLVSITNDSLHHTFAELEKVLINTGTKRLTAEDVKKVAGGVKKYSIYDFLDEVGNKNFYKSIEICNALVQMGTTTPFFISKLYNFFNDMYVCFTEDVEQMFSYNWKKKKQIRQTIGNYRTADFGKIFHNLVETDMKAKSTQLSDEELLVPLIYEIMNA